MAARRNRIPLVEHVIRSLDRSRKGARDALKALDGLDAWDREALGRHPPFVRRVDELNELLARARRLLNEKRGA